MVKLVISVKGTKKIRVISSRGLTLWNCRLRFLTFWGHQTICVPTHCSLYSVGVLWNCEKCQKVFVSQVVLSANSETSVREVLVPSSTLIVSLPACVTEVLVPPPPAVADRVGGLTLITLPVHGTWGGRQALLLLLLLLLTGAPTVGGRQYPGQPHEAGGQLGLNVRPQSAPVLWLVHQLQVRSECFVTLEQTFWNYLVDFWL